jgi:hypothetical protein
MSNNKNNAPLLGANRFLFPIFVLIFSTVAFMQCKKETTLPNEQKMEQRQATEREHFSVSKPWLIQFQNDLNTVIADKNATVTTYTPDQIAAGVETLINLFVGRPQSERGAHLTKTSTFEVDISGNSTLLKTLYEHAYKLYLDQKAAVDASAKPLSVSVSIDSVKNTIAYVSTRTIFTWDCVCFKERFTVSNVAPCATAFSQDEGFFVGGGDEDGVITDPSLYINPMCDEGCGNIAPCTAGPTTAYEAIEERLNYNYAANNPIIPPAGYELVGFTDILCSDPDYIDPAIYQTCGGQLSQYVGTCFTYDGSDPLNPSDPLNCIYCQLYEAMIDNEAPFQVPQGYRLISVNMGLYYCQCGGATTCDAITQLLRTHCWGKPVFKRKIIIVNNPTLPTQINIEDYIIE